MPCFAGQSFNESVSRIPTAILAPAKVVRFVDHHEIPIRRRCLSSQPPARGHATGRRDDALVRFKWAEVLMNFFRFFNAIIIE